MFSIFPKEVIQSDRTFKTLTRGAMNLPIEYLGRDIATIVKETVVDFGHGPVTVREYQHGSNVPLEDRVIAA